MKNLILGTSIIWLPIIGVIIASKLAELITMDAIVNFVYLVLIVSVIKVLKS